MSPRRSLIALALTALACSISGGPQAGPGPEATGTLPASPLPATSTAAPPSPLPASPSPTPPPVITADNVAGLSVALTFGEDIVRSVAFSPDGSVVAAAEADPAASLGTVHLYETASGRRVRTLEGHASAVWGLTFSPDGRYLATASRDRTARVWDWTDGTTVATLEFLNEMVAVAFSPDSRTLAVGGVDEAPGAPLGDAAIWTYEVDTWEPRLKLAEYWNIPDIAFSPDGRLIVGGGTSRNARVWRADDGAELFILYHAGQVGSIAISPDGASAATALCLASQAGQCTRSAVWLWRLSDGTRIGALADFATTVGEVVYSFDGSVLFAASLDGALRAYATSDYRLLLETHTPPGAYERNIGDMALSADGRSLVTGGSGRIDLWRVGG